MSMGEACAAKLREGKRWLALIALASCSLALISVAEPGAVASSRNPFSSFPLYRDVSGNGPFATLGEGQLSTQTRWGAYASRVGSGRLGYERPCLSLARITRDGLYSDVHGCGTLAPTAKRQVPVYISITTSFRNRHGGPLLGESFIALSFDPAVRSAVLNYANGGQLNRRTVLFNAKQQRKTKLPPFRYLALGILRDVCVEEVIGYSQSGDELFSAETGLCF